jgi:hypothetical protein
MLKLIYGDKQNPLDTLDLSSSVLGFEASGFGAAGGPAEITYQGLSPRRAGQRRIITTRDNANFSLTYRFRGGGTTHIGRLQNRIYQFALRAQRWEEDRQGGPVWLEYRLRDGLDDIPRPVWGQWNHYLPVYAIEIPNWPDDMNRASIKNGNATGVVANFTCGPYSEGIERRAGAASGSVQVDPHFGVVVAEANTGHNLFPNPSFANTTSYLQNWNLDTDVIATQVTDPGLTRSHNSAAHVSNPGTVARKFSDSFTTLNGTYRGSAFVRNTSGQPVTTSDVQILIDGNAVTTYIADVGDGWYRASGVGSSSGSSECGLQLQVGASLIVDDMQLTEVASSLATEVARSLPFFNGDMLGCSWSTTAHNSATTITDGELFWPLGDELAGQFTVAGWFTPIGWPDTGVERTIFSYVDGTDYIDLSYTSNDEFTFRKRIGSTATYTRSFTVSSFEPCHVALIQSADQLEILINGGAAGISVTKAAGFESGGNLYLGSNPQIGGSANGDCAFDGWRIWQVALSDAQILQLYNNELAIKQALRLVGLPPISWSAATTSDGENDLTYSGGTIDVGFMLAGIDGDVPAKLRLDAQYSYDSTKDEAFFMARKAVSERWQGHTLDIYDNNFFEAFSTIVGSSGSATRALTSNINLLRGECQMVIIASTGAAADVEFTPFYQLDNEGAKVSGETVTRSMSTGNDKVFDIGSLMIDWAYGEPGTITVGVDLDTASATITIKGIILLPRPNAHIIPIVPSGDTLSATITNRLENGEAYGLVSGLYRRRHEYRGDPLTAIPHQYNWLWWIDYASNATADYEEQVLLNMDVVAYVTPQFLLPGGGLA